MLDFSLASSQEPLSRYRKCSREHRSLEVQCDFASRVESSKQARVVQIGNCSFELAAGGIRVLYRH
jgi:hypothetical protein